MFLSLQKMPKTKLGNETKNKGAKKGKKSPKCDLNNKVTTEESKQFFLESLSKKLEGSESENHGIKISHSPFTCTVIENLVENKEFLQDFTEELEGLEFMEKNNDLYKFR